MDIEKLLQEMTAAEKVALCHGATNFSVAGIPRLGIPPLTMSDGPHGVRQELEADGWEPLGRDDDYITYLPTATALAATWSVECARLFGKVLGSEARARGKDVILGPGVNLHRFVLCGRNFEYYSEDPVLAGLLAVPVITAIQEQGTAACVKHYALNSQEFYRTSVDARPDERTLREIYLPAFEAAVKDAGVFTIMGAYNRFRGQHCCHNDYLLNDILKGEWEFDGVVISDWAGCHDTFEAARFGLDIEMGTSSDFDNFHLAAPFLRAVEAGAIPESYLDDKVRRVLQLHQRLQAVRETAPAGALNTPEHRAAARRIAEEAVVLLKNDRGTLPFAPESLKKLLVVGANAVLRHHAGGASSAVKALREITPLEGLIERYGEDRVEFVMGYPATDGAVDLAGEWTVSFHRRGEVQAAETRTMNPLFVDWDKDVPEVYRSGHGRVVAEAEFTADAGGVWVFALYGGLHAQLEVFHKDRFLPMTESEPGMPHTLRVTLAAGETIRLRATYQAHPLKHIDPLQLKVLRPGAEAACDRSALAAKAQEADAVIFVGGQSHAQDYEGSDRFDLDLHDGQDELIAALAQANPRFAVLLITGSAVAMPWIDRVPAVLVGWYAGSEGGRAFAGVIAGDVNPSGRLPFTFPARLSDTPQEVFCDYNKDFCNYAEGVFMGYRWFDAKGIEPLFPFGHGLSYTSFRVDQLEVQVRPSAGTALRVRCRVANTGRRAGREVVQLYLGTPGMAAPRPVRELKGFAKVELAPGEAVPVEFNLSERDLAFYHPVNREWTVETGEHSVTVNGKSVKAVL